MRYFLASVLAMRRVNILHVALLPVSVPAVQILRASVHPDAWAHWYGARAAARAGTHTDEAVPTLVLAMVLRLQRSTTDLAVIDGQQASGWAAKTAHSTSICQVWQERWVGAHATRRDSFTHALDSLFVQDAYS
eukprot:SAG31_NODE_1342_length_8700_cov_12.667829_13_plen_133_part_01